MWRWNNGTPHLTRPTIVAGATAVQVAAAVRGRKCLMIANTGTPTVYLGTDATVTDATGWPVVGAQTPFDVLPDPQIATAIFAYAPAGTNGSLAVWDNY